MEMNYQEKVVLLSNKMALITSITSSNMPPEDKVEAVKAVLPKTEEYP